VPHFRLDAAGRAADPLRITGDHGVDRPVGPMGGAANAAKPQKKLALASLPKPAVSAALKPETVVLSNN